MTLYTVGESDDEGGEPTRRERLQVRFVAQRLLVDSMHSVLLFDEMEDRSRTTSRSGGTPSFVLLAARFEPKAPRCSEPASRADADPHFVRPPTARATCEVVLRRDVRGRTPPTAVARPSPDLVTQLAKHDIERMAMTLAPSRPSTTSPRGLRQERPQRRSLWTAADSMPCGAVCEASPAYSRGKGPRRVYRSVSTLGSSVPIRIWFHSQIGSPKRAPERCRSAFRDRPGRGRARSFDTSRRGWGSRSCKSAPRT